jgi:hypothetical protein
LLAGTITADVSTVTGQQYDQTAMIGYGDQDDFAQANLYADYAAKQQEKAVRCVTVIGSGSLVHAIHSILFIRFFIKAHEYEDNVLHSDWFSICRKLSLRPASDLSSSSCVAVFQEEKERTMMFNQLQNGD